jgi:protein arginine kinase activator
MLCNICHNKYATIHITEIVNNVKKELHLCEDCAKQKGVVQKVQFSLSDLLSGLIEQKSGKPLKDLVSSKCPHCGMTFKRLRSKMRLGCPNDLDAFKNWLELIVEKIHNATQHVGKQPSIAGERLKKEAELLRLKKELDDAVKKEDFEKAAKVRDQIKAVEIDLKKKSNG